MYGYGGLEYQSLRNQVKCATGGDNCAIAVGQDSINPFEIRSSVLHTSILSAVITASSSINPFEIRSSVLLYLNLYTLTADPYLYQSLRNQVKCATREGTLH